MDRLVFMGTPHFGQLILSVLISQYEIAAVVTQPDRQAGRGRRTAVSPVKALALAKGLPVLQPQSLREADVLQRLQTLAPAAIIVAAFGKILPHLILTLPRRSCINVHASLLPRHRGAAPIPAAILAGDERTGVTIMLMEEGLDTGPILSQAAMDITEDDTTGSLTDKLGELGGQLLLETLPRWLAAQITPHKQDDSQATYAGLLHRDDGLICWTEDAVQIARRCRAFHPWPGAFTLWGGKELKVLRARPSPSTSVQDKPGRVMVLDSEVAVATGSGVLILEEIQLAGKRRLSARDFVQGQRSFVGSILQWATVP